jgi:hypothetical protein
MGLGGKLIERNEFLLMYRKFRDKKITLSINKKLKCKDILKNLIDDENIQKDEEF